MRSSPLPVDDDLHRAAVLELAEQQLVGERLLDVLLDDARQRPGAELLVVALLGEPLRVASSDSSIVTPRSASCASSWKMNFSTTLVITSGGRPANGMTASRRLRNSGVNMRLMASVSSPSRFDALKPIGGVAMIGRARVRRHDQDDVAEVDLLAVVVGQLAVVHHLQQDVEQVRMRLLDLVEQQHAVRMLVDAVGQQAALVEADVARTARRSDG